MTPSGPRERLVAAVVEHALAHGIADSLRAIAASVGTSHRMLLHHFGSREGLLVEVTRAVEERQRDMMRESAALSGGDPVASGAALWEHLCRPELAPQERLFFELYAQGLQGRPFAQPLLAGVVEDWVGPLAELLEGRGISPAEARADARLMVAVVRGLLLDLLATGERQAVDEAMARFARLYLGGAAAVSPQRRRQRKKGASTTR